MSGQTDNRVRLELPTRVQEVLRSVPVCELSTVNRDGTPSTRPVCALWQPDRGRFITATPVAFPQKAFNVRRDSRVALLFSDFSGSGLGAAPVVLVQGRATAPDHVLGVEPLDDWWRFVYSVAPHQARTACTPEARPAMEFYYWRLAIYVVPDRVWSWPDADSTPERVA